MLSMLCKNLTADDILKYDMGASMIRDLAAAIIRDVKNSDSR